MIWRRQESVKRQCIFFSFCAPHEFKCCQFANHCRNRSILQSAWFQESSSFDSVRVWHRAGGVVDAQRVDLAVGIAFNKWTGWTWLIQWESRTFQFGASCGSTELWVFENENDKKKGSCFLQNAPPASRRAISASCCSLDSLCAITSTMHIQIEVTTKIVGNIIDFLNELLDNEI